MAVQHIFYIICTGLVSWRHVPSPFFLDYTLRHATPGGYTRAFRAAVDDTPGKSRNIVPCSERALLLKSWNTENVAARQNRSMTPRARAVVGNTWQENNYRRSAGRVCDPLRFAWYCAGPAQPYPTPPKKGKTKYGRKPRCFVSTWGWLGCCDQATVTRTGSEIP